MTKKDVAIERMLNGDASGRLRLLHNQLVSIGLKTRMPSNSSTLLFQAVDNNGKRLDLAALRDAGGDVLSFPSSYWRSRMAELESALTSIDKSHFIGTGGSFTTSQYSARQVSVSAVTIASLERVASGLIASHVREITGDA